MILTIHRGTKEIGGNCVEIRSRDTTVFIDAGLALDGSPTQPPDALSEADAIFISHCHRDHFGLIETASGGPTLHTGEVGWKFIQSGAAFSGRKIGNWDVSFLRSKHPVTIGPITVTPYLMDHSAPDAYAFLVEGDGKRMLYTGDFRAHGRKAGLFAELVDTPPRDIDALILEGTAMGRSSDRTTSEKDVENELRELLRRERGAGFIICSAQNVDRLVSAYRASRRAGRDIVIDLYTAWILEQMRTASKRVPGFEWRGVRVLAHGRWAARQYSLIKRTPELFGSFLRDVYGSGATLKFEALARSPEKYLIKTGAPQALRMLKEMNAIRHVPASVAYSMWPGYMSPELSPGEVSPYEELKAMEDVTFEIIHASGHADIGALSRLVRAVRPRHVIPIHTGNRGKYRELFENTLMVNDGEVIDLRGLP